MPDLRYRRDSIGMKPPDDLSILDIRDCQTYASQQT